MPAILDRLQGWFVFHLRMSYSGSTSMVEDDDLPLVPPMVTDAFCDKMERDLANPLLPAMVVLPTGVGKSGVMCMTPFAALPTMCCKSLAVSRSMRVLVVCPNTEVKLQMVAAFRGFYRDRFDLQDAPIVTELSTDTIITASQEALQHCETSKSTSSKSSSSFPEVFVATYQSLSRPQLLHAIPTDAFDLILVDEAHHTEALSYRVILERFCGSVFVSRHRCLCVFFTGTPYRSHSHEILRAVPIYQCTLRDALDRPVPYIKHPCYEPLKIESMTLRHRHSGHVVTLSSFEEIASESGNQLAQVICRSDDACLSLIGAVIQKLRQIRPVKSNSNGSTTGVLAQALLQASDTDEAEKLVRLWNNHSENQDPSPHLSIAAVHSGMAKVAQEMVLTRLKGHQLDAIVHVGMLGEGFDHPPLFVVAIFKPFASMPPFVQLVGRVLRRFPSAASTNYENRAFVLAHPALGLHRHWKLYKMDNENNNGLQDNVEDQISPTENDDSELNGAPSRKWSEYELLSQEQSSNGTKEDWF